VAEELLNGADNRGMCGYIDVIGPAQQLGGASLHDPEYVFCAGQIFDIGRNEMGG
jgi:hypothetical protein